MSVRLQARVSGGATCRRSLARAAPAATARPSPLAAPEAARPSTLRQIAGPHSRAAAAIAGRPARAADRPTGSRAGGRKVIMHAAQPCNSLMCLRCEIS